MKKGQSAMEYLMTYGWALLVIVIVIAVLLYINPFRAPEQCLFDQAGFLCAKPILLVTGADATGAQVTSLLHASLTNGQREAITLRGILCVASRVPPSGEISNWPQSLGLGTGSLGRTLITKDMDYQETIDLGNFTQSTGSPSPDGSVRCLTSADATARPITLRPGETFSGRLYIAYNYATEDRSTPPKIVGANLVTQAQ